MKRFCLSIFLCVTFVLNAQIDTNAPSFQIVGDYFGNNYSVFYPLGWSESGNLAYISQNVNGLSGALIYSYKLGVTDNQGWGNLLNEVTTYNLEVDTSFWSHHQEFSEYVDTTFFGYGFMKNVYWDFHKEQIAKIMSHYNIIYGKDNYVLPLSNLKSQGITINLTKETDTIDVIRIDKSFSINIEFNGTTKNICAFNNEVDENGWTVDFWGNHTDLLYYKIEGFLKSPHTNTYFLYVHEITLGFEEPAERVHLIPFSIEN